MIDTNEETIEQTRERIERGEKLFKIYTDPEVVKQAQIKEFEKFGMNKEAEPFRLERARKKAEAWAKRQPKKEIK